MTETMECDVLIVGGGPAGLSAAIRLRQLDANLSVILLEKGSEIGAHILSGAVMDPTAMNELLPDWKEKGAPLNVPVITDEFSFLTPSKKFRLPTPPPMKNHGNFVVSLANICRFLAREAETLGVQIFPGFPAAEAIIEDGAVKGVCTGAFGVAKNGEQKPSYQPPMELRAKTTLFAEGCRGSLSEQLMKTFHLRDGRDPQTYGIGIKEIWQVAPEKHKAGHVQHSVGWPMNSNTYGGSFIYHLDDHQVAIGFVVGLDYKNPYLDPFKEFQRFKTHAAIRPLLEGGKRLAYGARALNEGGWQSIPKLTFPGGALIGCAAGFLNVPRIKGSHLAMKSGILAAECLVKHFSEGGLAPPSALGLTPAANGSPPPTQAKASIELTDFETTLKNSWAGRELYSVRNIRPAFRYGLWAGLVLSALDTYLFRGGAPWTLKHHEADHQATEPARCHQPINYPAPDGLVSFDRTSSVYLSNTNHEEDQPCHLVLREPKVFGELNLPVYDAPEQRFCPAGVYEVVEEAGAKRLQINAQNCVHCKTCDIKDTSQNIRWVTPEGGGGPNYGNM